MGLKSYRDCGYTCNPHKFEIPALRFPCRVPVIPCKHLQCNSFFATAVVTNVTFEWLLFSHELIQNVSSSHSFESRCDTVDWLLFLMSWFYTSLQLSISWIVVFKILTFEWFPILMMYKNFKQVHTNPSRFNKDCI